MVGVEWAANTHSTLHSHTYLPGALCQALCWELMTDTQATQGLLSQLLPG